MFIRQNKMMLLWILLVVSSFNGSSSNTVVTYTTKNVEELPCVIDEKTLTATWRDDTTVNTLYIYRSNSDEIDIRNLQPKHDNFNYSYVDNSHFNLVIEKVEREDGGTYTCEELGDATNETVYHITVEAVPDEISFDCFVPPDVTCPAQGVTSTSELICTCAAKGVHPGTLSLSISGVDNVHQDSPVANDGLFDLSLKATVPVTDSVTEVTCSVEGYSTTGEPIPPTLITKKLVISPPACDLEISFDKACEVATLNCSCSAMPTDGESPSDSGIVFSYFNEAGHLIAGNATNPVQINDIEAGVDLTYSCRGCNGLYYGKSSYVTESKVCTITTESTTEKSESTTTNEPGSSALGAGGIAGIIVGVVAVIIVIVVIAVIVCKKGKDDSKPQNSSVADGNVTATNINITSSEPPAPVYGVVKKDSKKKSDKPDDNGAGPGKDPEIPAYGVIDNSSHNRKKVKDPTPAPRSSLRDSTNSSKPKQDMEMQYADLDHGNKPPSDEVRKPKEEPTEYATVQSVIV